MNALYAILVVYNQCIKDSSTYKFLNKHKDINVIVCDNSTQDYKNQSVVKSDGYIYRYAWKQGVIKSL